MPIDDLYESLCSMRDEKVRMEKAYRHGFARQIWRIEKVLWQSPVLRFVFFRLLGPFTLPQYRLARTRMWRDMVEIFLSVYRPHIFVLANIPESQRFIERATYVNAALKSAAEALASSPFKVHADIDAVTGRVTDPLVDHPSRLVIMDVDLAELLYYGECLRSAARERVDLLHSWTNTKTTVTGLQLS